jgi:hypothetical protein
LVDARRRYHRVVFDATDVREPGGYLGLPKLARVAIAGVRYHRGRRHTLNLQSLNLAERDLSLELERGDLRYAHGPSPPTVSGSDFGYIELIGDREAHSVVCHRHAHHHLVVFLFARYPEVLAASLTEC